MNNSLGEKGRSKWSFKFNVSANKKQSIIQNFLLEPITKTTKKFVDFIAEGFTL